MSAAVNKAARDGELIAAQGIWNWRGLRCVKQWARPT